MQSNSQPIEDNTSEGLTAKTYWETNPTAAIGKQGYWLSNPIIEAAINHRLSGAKGNGYWLSWLANKFFKKQRFERLLSIGCGVGNHEILMAKLGLATQIDAFDFSESSLEIARKDAAAAGVEINFYQDDFNLFTIDDSKKYDLVFCSGSLHHVRELERCLSIVRKCLKPDGYFIVNEYIGDCYNIYNQNQEALINRIYKCFDYRLRSGTTEIFASPSIERVFAKDPSEAVRSKLILPFLEFYFDVEVLNPAGGGLLHELYPLLDHYQLSDGDPKSETIVKLLLEIEKILMEMPGGLSSDFCLCILRHKKPKTMEITPPKIDYERAWDSYAQEWKENNPELAYLGDEWIGKGAGAANSLSEYESLIEQEFIAPYIKKEHRVLEIGIGGGKTSSLLLKYCDRLICADISSQMLEATRSRLGDDRVSYVKLNGLTLDGIAPESADACFCYDTMVHVEPVDIFNYLTRIPKLLRGDRICVFHHGNILSELGWEKFTNEWDKNLLGRRDGTAFSVMTDTIMEKFLNHLNYEIILKNTSSVPRDCVWICKAPLVSSGG
ncbi:class I SAM-dependent methyltransferase [Microcoleus sp.]|uniref:class I SAM-dependent methyltransferase n=1 Tax=Microcoleus sp. TaxID=44472 RepID=UPI003523F8A3